MHLTTRNFPQTIAHRMKLVEALKATVYLFIISASGEKNLHEKRWHSQDVRYK